MPITSEPNLSRFSSVAERARDCSLAREWKAPAGQVCVESADGGVECLDRVEDRPVHSPHGEKVCDVLSLDELGQDGERVLHDSERRDQLAIRRLRFQGRRRVRYEPLETGDRRLECHHTRATVWKLSDRKRG